MRDRAYAKINLAMDVFNVREDGYHDIRSVMVPIDFYDLVTIDLAKEDSCWCNRSFIVFDEHNSLIKMIKALKEEYGFTDHYRILLDKRIPTKAGLGGGTADAASVLRIFQRLYQLKMSDEKIIKLCLKVGADVPFNYYNVPATVSGIGDVIDPFEMKKTYYLLLVKPRSGVSTKRAYEELDMDVCDHPDVDRLKKALENGDSISGLLGNSLEQPAFIINSEIRRIKEDLQSYGIGEVLMSGSGSTVFCISEDREAIAYLYEVYRNKPYYLRFTRTLDGKK